DVAPLLGEPIGRTAEHQGSQLERENDETDRRIKRYAGKIQARRDVTLAAGGYLALADLGRMFSLSPFEEDCIVISLAPELNLKYAKLYAYLQDDITRKQPTVDFVLRLLCGS